MAAFQKKFGVRIVLMIFIIYAAEFKKYYKRDSFVYCFFYDFFKLLFKNFYRPLTSGCSIYLSLRRGRLFFQV